ncbi:hypothetical protein T439DRAFT_173966 [Meredithblackwellia eburnea MCA 4105]
MSMASSSSSNSSTFDSASASPPPRPQLVATSMGSWLPLATNQLATKLEIDLDDDADDEHDQAEEEEESPIPFSLPGPLKPLEPSKSSFEPSTSTITFPMTPPHTPISRFSSPSVSTSVSTSSNAITPAQSDIAPPPQTSYSSQSTPNHPTSLPWFPRPPTPPSEGAILRFMMKSRVGGFRPFDSTYNSLPSSTLSSSSAISTTGSPTFDRAVGSPARSELTAGAAAAPTMSTSSSFPTTPPTTTTKLPDSTRTGSSLPPTPLATTLLSKTSISSFISNASLSPFRPSTSGASDSPTTSTSSSSSVPTPPKHSTKNSPWSWPRTGERVRVPLGVGSPLSGSGSDVDRDGFAETPTKKSLLGAANTRVMIGERVEKTECESRYVRVEGVPKDSRREDLERWFIKRYSGLKGCFTPFLHSAGILILVFFDVRDALASLPRLRSARDRIGGHGWECECVDRSWMEEVSFISISVLLFFLLPLVEPPSRSVLF